MKEAEHENAKKKSELSSLSSKCKTLESQSRHKDKQLTKLNKKISMLEKNMQKYVQQVGNLSGTLADSVWKLFFCCSFLNIVLYS